MKHFSFPLEKVLSIRQFQQEQAEFALSKARAAENAIQEQLNDIAKKHAATVSLTESSTDFTAIVSAQQYYVLLENQKEQLLQDLTQAKIVTEQKRKDLQLAMQKCTAVTKLKEKMYEQYQQEVMQEEEIQLDDVVTSRFKR
ncbi:MAG: flagellar export protein FliJ [Treponema sp.]|nr:flagellar export protein FliJ [Treponema sp.]